MTRLDDPAAIAAGDPSGLLGAFLGSSEGIRAGYEAGRETEIAPGARSVTLCGMGGSAAGADVAVAAFAERIRVPASVVRGYTVPAHVGADDLVVCLSHSGATEEALACWDEAVSRGARAVAISSGGPLAERAAGRGVRIPGDAPMPRAGLGALAGAAVGALEAAGLIAAAEEVEEAGDALEGLAKEIGAGAPTNEAIEIAEAVGSHVPVIWGSLGIAEPAAFRWKAAFNENAKIPAFASSFPELNHHEVAGWSEARGRGFVVLVLRHDGEHPSVGPRLEATVPELEISGAGWREVRARGGAPLARMLTLILLGDAASTYHALARGVDPTPIAAIDAVKRRLTGGA